MNLYFLPLAIASFSTLFALIILRPIAFRFKLLDKPNSRKKHDGLVPLIGGLAMFFGVYIGLFFSSIEFIEYKHIFLSSLFILLVGYTDDHYTLSVWPRLLFQILASCFLVFVASANIDSLGNLFGNGEVYLNSWTVFFSVLAYIAGMNALNMVDGMHGLAGGNSLITLFSIVILSLLNGIFHGTFLAYVCCAVIPIFLIENLCIGRLNKYRVFMGDAGSMFLGLTIAYLLITLSQGEQKLFSPVTALWIFSLPLLDMFLTIFRRLYKGGSPFQADLGHLHHVLAQYGFSQRKILLLILSFSLLMSCVGIIGELRNVHESTMMMLFIAVFIIYSFVMHYSDKGKYI